MMSLLLVYQREFVEAYYARQRKDARELPLGEQRELLRGLGYIE